MRICSCLSKLFVPRGSGLSLLSISFLLERGFFLCTSLGNSPPACGMAEPARNRRSNPLSPHVPKTASLETKAKVSHLSITKFPSLLRIPAHMSHSSLSDGRVYGPKTGVRLKESKKSRESCEKNAECQR